jgi:hypothetical protein
MALTVMMALFSSGTVSASNDFQVWAADPAAQVSREDTPGPDSKENRIVLDASRNGFASGQFAVRSAQPLEGLSIHVSSLKGPGRAEIPSSQVQVRFVGYVEIGASQGGWGDDHHFGQMPDPLLEVERLDVAANQTQPVWLTFNVARTVLPGKYRGKVTVLANGRKLAALPVELKIDAFTLPDPEDYSFYLDLWQHPAQIADQLGLKRWSEEHWKILEVYLRELARAGQKVINTTIIEEPWGGQTYVHYDSLVVWTGYGREFTWDYTLFDRYVQLCIKAGIRRAISAYSLVLGPGGRRDCVIAYRDAQSGERKLLRMEVGDETYRAVWTAFLLDFKKHLDAMGWLGITQIAFDEKPADIMETAIGLVRQVAPELKIELAGNYHAEIDAGIQDYCIAYPGTDSEIARARRARGQVTTFYTCCGPAFPNTFSFSPLTEPRLLPWHAAAIGSDGYLRWAWNSWPKDPMTTPDFGPWPSGDTFLVYPGKEGPISTLRWEAFKAGVQDFELIAAVRKKLEMEADAELEETLRQALELATRNPNGKDKDLSDLPRARAMLVRALLKK